MNPKGKKTIGLCVSETATTTGKDLRDCIQEFFKIFSRVGEIIRAERSLTARDWMSIAKEVDLNLIKKIEEDIVK